VTADLTPRSEVSRIGRGFTPGLYLGRNDRIFIRTHNAGTGVTIGIRARTMEPDGSIKEHAWTTVPTTARVLSTDSFDVGEAVLVGLTARAEAGTVRRGQCFVQLGIARGGTLVSELSTVLISGYVTGDGLVAWPGGTLRDSVDGPGMLRSVTGTNPGAGSQVSETVPTNTRWLLRALRMSLVTSAVVAVRRVHVIVDDGATTQLEVTAGDSQAASLTQLYHAGSWGYAPALADTVAVIPMPPDVWLLQGWRVRTTLTNGDAGDDFGAPQLLVEEWIEV
jgi:hypothetical protein